MQYHRCYQVRKKQGESSKDFMKRCADKQRFIEHKCAIIQKKIGVLRSTNWKAQLFIEYI